MRLQGAERVEGAEITDRHAVIFGDVGHVHVNALAEFCAKQAQHPRQERCAAQMVQKHLAGHAPIHHRHRFGAHRPPRPHRFGHRLITDIQKSEESLVLKLPSLLLQPIVENAIKFGLYDTVGEITISISTRKENNLLLIEVKNPFDPATASPRQGTGFGLSSVQRRLYLIYFRNDLLSTSQSENVFVTTIKIPQIS